MCHRLRRYGDIARGPPAGRGHQPWAGELRGKKALGFSAFPPPSGNCAESCCSPAREELRNESPQFPFVYSVLSPRTQRTLMVNMTCDPQNNHRECSWEGPRCGLCADEAKIPVGETIVVNQLEVI